MAAARSVEHDRAAARAPKAAVVREVARAAAGLKDHRVRGIAAVDRATVRDRRLTDADVTRAEDGLVGTDGQAVAGGDGVDAVIATLVVHRRHARAGESDVPRQFQIHAGASVVVAGEFDGQVVGERAHERGVAADGKHERPIVCHIREGG